LSVRLLNRRNFNLEAGNFQRREDAVGKINREMVSDEELEDTTVPRATK
jgi:hypothetical protein